MKTLLVVTDNPAFFSRLRQEPLTRQWSMHTSSGCAETMQALYNWDPDAVIIDASTDSGRLTWQIYDRIREVSDVPVLLLTPAADSELRLAALRRGVDNVISEEEPTAEILLRARNLAHSYRRQTGHNAGTNCSSYGSLTFDASLRRLDNGDRVVNLTEAEALLLQRFLQEPDRVLTPTELAIALWGETGHQQAKGIKVYVLRLRRKLRACDPDGRYLVTHPAIGYRFQPE